VEGQSVTTALFPPFLYYQKEKSMNTNSIAMKALGLGNCALGYSAEGTGFGLQYAGKGIKAVGTFLEDSGVTLRAYGQGKVRLGELCLKVSSGNVTEAEMREFGFSEETITEYKAKVNGTAPAPKNTGAGEGRTVDPKNSVVKDYKEGEEMSPADCAELMC
jgi:hypothetical protein